MFENSHAVPMIAVRNIKKAKDFYENTLGLRLERFEDMPMYTIHTGGADVTLYESEFAGTNKANALTWAVGTEFDQIIEALAKKGVRFEHYSNLPGTKIEGDIHVAGKMKLAWFKDPDGNILHVNNGPTA